MQGRVENDYGFNEVKDTSKAKVRLKSKQSIESIFFVINNYTVN